MAQTHVHTSIIMVFYQKVLICVWMPLPLRWENAKLQSDHWLIPPLFTEIVTEPCSVLISLEHFVSVHSISVVACSYWVRIVSHACGPQIKIIALKLFAPLFNLVFQCKNVLIHCLSSLERNTVYFFFFFFFFFKAVADCSVVRASV